MKDYNFFSDYIFVKSTFQIKRLITPIVFLFLIASIASVYLYMDNEENGLQETFDANQKILDSKEFEQVSKEVIILREKVTDLRAISEEVVVFDYLMTQHYPVTDKLMSDILSITPRNVAFTSYSITDTMIDISAITTDYAYVSEMESNLRKSPTLNDVFVVNIATDSEDIYSFSIQIQIGGGLLE